MEGQSFSSGAKPTADLSSDPSLLTAYNLSLLSERRLIAACPPPLQLGEIKSAEHSRRRLGSQPPNAPITGSINLGERKLQEDSGRRRAYRSAGSPVEPVIRAERRAMPPGKSGHWPCRWSWPPSHPPLLWCYYKFPQHISQEWDENINPTGLQRRLNPESVLRNMLTCSGSVAAWFMAAGHPAVEH